MTQLSIDQIYILEMRIFEVWPIFILGGPAPHPLPTGPIWSTFGSHPLRMIPTKFGWNPPPDSGEKDENVKS